MKKFLTLLLLLISTSVFSQSGSRTDVSMDSVKTESIKIGMMVFYFHGKHILCHEMEIRRDGDKFVLQIDKKRYVSKKKPDRLIYHVVRNGKDIVHLDIYVINEELHKYIYVLGKEKSIRKPNKWMKIY